MFIYLFKINEYVQSVKVYTFSNVYNLKRTQRGTSKTYTDL